MIRIWFTAKEGDATEKCKCESPSPPVKSPPGTQILVCDGTIAYFCPEMKTAGRIIYWIVALGLVSAVLVSLGYSWTQALLISLVVFGPCSLALEFLFPKAKKVLDKVWLSLAVFVTAFFLILLVHHWLWDKAQVPEYYWVIDVKPVLINPVFLGIIFTVLALGDVFCLRWLDRRFPSVSRPITFFSDRRSVTVNREDIAYIESNDTEVRVFLRDGTSYRNKTGISQWENLLGEGFLRIHRSYLVNQALASAETPDSVSVGGVSLPDSRNYRDRVQESLGA